ncbi:MAG: beta-ketoacyl-[acyl-carrier-protein] synthase family protein [Bacilli bacterium]
MKQREANRVVITGMGCVTPIGNDVASFSDALFKGRTGFTFASNYFGEKWAEGVVGAVDCVLDDYFTARQQKRMDRVSMFAVLAAQQAWTQSGMDESNFVPENTGVVVGTGVGGLNSLLFNAKNFIDEGFRSINPLCVPLFLPNMSSAHIAMTFGITGQVSTESTACAAGTHAIGEAYRRIKHGYADVMLCGGAESCLHPFMYGAFTQLCAVAKKYPSVPFDEHRNGFILGEGAGMLLMESYHHAKQRGAPILAEVVGYAHTNDAYHLTTPEPESKSMIACMEKALLDAEITCNDIQYINAHGTGTLQNDVAESYAIGKVFTSNKALRVNSTKSMIGHLLGAAGAVESVATILQMQQQNLHGNVGLTVKDVRCNLHIAPHSEQHAITYALSNSFGFGGHNGSIIFRNWH